MTDSRLASSFVQAAKYRVNPGRPLRLIVIHDMEAPEGPATAENCAQYFAGPSAGGSAHYCVDQDSIVQCVKEADQAAHAPGANTDGIGIELAGYARFSTDEWLAEPSHSTLALAAQLARDISARTGIPPRWLSDDEVRNGAKGMTTHAAISRIYRQSDHSDPGPNFPADEFMRLVGTTQTEDDMTPEEHAALFDAVARLNDIQANVKSNTPGAPSIYALCADTNAWKGYSGMSADQIEQALKSALGDGFNISITPKG